MENLKDHISHIPQVVTQHGLFLSSKDAPVIAAKPGQSLYDREGFYTSEVKRAKNNYIQETQRAQSEYQEQIGITTHVKDYTYQGSRRMPLIPAALAIHKKRPGEGDAKPKGPEFEPEWQEKLDATLTKVPTSPTAGSSGSKGPRNTGAAIWSSTYRETHTKCDDAIRAECKNYVRLRGPKFAVAHPPQCLGEEPYTSQYSSDYGIAGSVPTEKLVIASYTYDGRIQPKEDGFTRIVDERAIREKTLMEKVGDIAKDGRSGEAPELPREAITKFVTVKHELTKGTTRGTSHIPGYQGYIPVNTSNRNCAKIECGIGEREKWFNLAEQYHLNIPGYTGHLPYSSINDRGTRQVNSMSTYNRDYARTAGLVIANSK
ncbi:unnamed protein product [Amoebophrya sp. A25]|nr:unnamed protein product [Amoebophrya sp. A25]|eukprot:GSA25T00002338001.1